MLPALLTLQGIHNKYCLLIEVYLLDSLCLRLQYLEDNGTIYCLHPKPSLFLLWSRSSYFSSDISKPLFSILLQFAMLYQQAEHMDIHNSFQTQLGRLSLEYLVQ